MIAETPRGAGRGGAYNAAPMRRLFVTGGLLAGVAILALLVVASFSDRWIPNHPYPVDERGGNTYYTSFIQRPKHLDPAISYSSDEYVIIDLIYEPPLDYHYLKRPYELMPVTVEQVPVPEYFDAEGNRLEGDPPVEQVAKAVYTIRVKPGIRYAPHPCFARAPDGAYRYHAMTEADLDGIDDIGDFRQTGTRELTAADYVYQIRRMADPNQPRTCPILETLAQYIDGLGEYAEALEADLERTRVERKAAGGILYSRDIDEREHPIFLDYDAHPLPGVELVDERTYRIILKRKYPQIRYWLAMPFFAPMPWEAVRFFRQAPMIERSLSLDRYPVGTGPYTLTKMDENLEIVLERNPVYREVPYPSEGEPGDHEAGLLDDAGRPIPFIDRIVRRREKEAMPRWHKFVQGYYDESVIQEDVFTQAIGVSLGRQNPTPSLRDRGISLSIEVAPSTWYYGFNMLDPAVGGLTPEQRKLRQAISIALDTEEYIQIFNNGRGVAGHSPIPLGIAGSLDGGRQFNPFAYDWDESAGKPVRKSLDEAKRLLAEAGYPNGQDAQGRPLVIHYDNQLDQPGGEDELRWVQSRFAKINLVLECRTTDYNRFQEKVRTGDFQFFSWGWNADYPDPENFLFLLYGPNGKHRSGGENASNYENPEFDALFRRMESMQDGPERAEVIGRMVRILQEDVPWCVREHVVDFRLGHAWLRNDTPNPMARGILKYFRIDPAMRERCRREWNRPVWWPVWALLGGVVVIASPAALVIRRRSRASGRAS